MLRLAFAAFAASPPKRGKTFGTQSIDRVRAGHGKPGKSWNLIVGHGKSWKIKVMLDRLDTADVKAMDNVRKRRVIK